MANKISDLNQEFGGLSLQQQEQQPAVRSYNSPPLNQVLHANGRLLRGAGNAVHLTNIEGAEISKILRREVSIESRFPEVSWQVELPMHEILMSVSYSVPSNANWSLQLIGGAVPVVLKQYLNQVLLHNKLGDYCSKLQEGIDALGGPNDIDFRFFIDAPEGTRVNLLTFSQGLIKIMAAKIPEEVVESAEVLAFLQEKLPNVQFTPNNKEEYRKQIALNTGFQKIKKTTNEDVSYFTMTPNVAKGVIGPEILVALSMPKVTLCEHDDICLDITSFLDRQVPPTIYPISFKTPPLQVAMDFVTKTTARTDWKDRTLSAWSRTVVNMVKGFHHRDEIFTPEGVSDSQVGKDLGKSFRYHLKHREDVRAKLIILALIASGGRDFLPSFKKEVEDISCEEGSAFEKALFELKASPRAILAALPLLGHDVPSAPPVEEITEEVLPLFYSSGQVERTALASGLVHNDSPLLQELGIHFGVDPSLERVAMILPGLIPHIHGERRGRMQRFLQSHGVIVDFEEAAKDQSKWIEAFAKSGTTEFVDRAVGLLVQLPQEQALSCLQYFANSLPQSLEMQLPRLVEDEQSLGQISDEACDVLVSLFTSTRVTKDSKTYSKLRLASSPRLQKLWVLHAGDIDVERLLELLPDLLSDIPKERLQELGINVKTSNLSDLVGFLLASDDKSHVKRGEELHSQLSVREGLRYLPYLTNPEEFFLRLEKGEDFTELARIWKVVPQPIEVKFQQVCLERVRKGGQTQAVIRGITEVLNRVTKVNQELFVEVVKREEDPIVAARLMASRMKCFAEKDFPKNFMKIVIQRDIKIAITLFQGISIEDPDTWRLLIEGAAKAKDEKVKLSVYQHYLKKGQKFADPTVSLYQLWMETLEETPPKYSREILVKNRPMLLRYMSQLSDGVKTERVMAVWKEGFNRLFELWGSSKEEKDALVVTGIYLNAFSGALPIAYFSVFSDRLYQITDFMKDKKCGEEISKCLLCVVSALAKMSRRQRKANASLYERTKESVSKTCRLYLQSLEPLSLVPQEVIFPIWYASGDKESLLSASRSLVSVLGGLPKEKSNPLVIELVEELLSKPLAALADNACTLLKSEDVSKNLPKETHSPLVARAARTFVNLQAKEDADKVVDKKSWEMYLFFLKEIYEHSTKKEYGDVFNNAHYLLYRSSVENYERGACCRSIGEYREKLAEVVDEYVVYLHLLHFFRTALHGLIDLQIADEDLINILKEFKLYNNYLLSGFEKHKDEQRNPKEVKFLMNEFSQHYLDLANKLKNNELVHSATVYQEKVKELNS